MAFTDTDRRRLIMATTLTLLALPALWWANTSDDSTAPNVAVAGIEVGESPHDSHTPAGDPSDAPLDPASDRAPVFLNGPSSAAGAAVAQIAVPGKPAIDHVTMRATFRSSVGGTDTCLVPGMTGGLKITVVNLNNNRSLQCTTVLAPAGVDQLILHTSAFAEIADLTDAPIAVEIRR